MQEDYDIKDKAYQLDEQNLRKIQFPLFKFINIVKRNSDIQATPKLLSEKYYYIFDGLGDITMPYFQMFKLVIHHEIDLKSPSALLINFLQRVYQKLKQQDLEDEQIIKQIFGDRDHQHINIIDKIAKGKVKSLLRGSEKKNPIENYLRTCSQYKDKDLTQEIKQYIKYMERNLSYISIKPRKNKIIEIQRKIQRFKGCFFLSLEGKDERDKLRLLGNRYDVFQHFQYQKNSQKTLRRSEQNISITNLDDLIVSYRQKIDQQTGKLSENRKKEKDELYQKLYKDLSFELINFYETTKNENGQSIQYPYLNPTSIYLNVEKQFFFLSAQPVISHNLLGYQMLPSTQSTFFEVQRKNKVQNMFKAPEERKIFQSKKQLDSNFYRFFLILSAFEKLEKPVTTPTNELYTIYRNRVLDSSPQCRKYFGQKTHSKLLKIIQSNKKKSELTLENLKEGLQINLQKYPFLEWAINKLWLKSLILKTVLKPYIDKEKNHNRMEQVKLLYYFSLFHYIRKKEIDYGTEDKNKLQKQYQEFKAILIQKVKQYEKNHSSWKDDELICKYFNKINEQKNVTDESKYRQLIIEGNDLHKNQDFTPKERHFHKLLSVINPQSFEKVHLLYMRIKSTKNISIFEDDQEKKENNQIEEILEQLKEKQNFDL